MRTSNQSPTCRDQGESIGEASGCDQPGRRQPVRRCDQAITSGSTSTRSGRQGPFGKTIAHGFMTLALLPRLQHQMYTVNGIKLASTTASTRSAFPAPVPVGSRVRAKSSLVDVEDLGNGAVQATCRPPWRSGLGQTGVCGRERRSLHRVGRGVMDADLASWLDEGLLLRLSRLRHLLSGGGQRPSAAADPRYPFNSFDWEPFGRR